MKVKKILIIVICIIMCSVCMAAVAACKMDVKKVGDGECISCGECAAVCPVKAISLGYKGPGAERTDAKKG